LERAPAPSAPPIPAPPRSPSPEPTAPIAAAAPAAAPAATAPPATAFIEGVTYLEDAVRKGKPVAEVSKELLTLLPASYLRDLVRAGPELAVGEIENRLPESVLVSPGGKRFLRELLGVLGADVDAAG
jgi:hypothetical protein